jgi:hypothetical protein
MWVAADETSAIDVWWSDSPYTTWSSPIKIATGIKDDDICLVTTFNGKVGVFWSDQTTKRFGFKTHADGDGPAIWSADEIPASQSALNIGAGMGDDHMSVKQASDGTLYFAVKTGYDTRDYPQLALLVRRPGGTWDDLYPVTIFEGTQPVVVLNEEQGTIKVIYTTIVNGGDIVYRESSVSDISFGIARSLISGGGHLYNYATSTHQTYNPDVVIIATNQSTIPLQAVSVLATDGTSVQSAGVSSKLITRADGDKLFPKAIESTELAVYPNPIQSNATIRFTLPEASNYIMTLYDNKGSRMSILKRGIAEVGIKNSVVIDGFRLPNGLYIIELKTNKSMKILKVIVSR